MRRVEASGVYRLLYPTVPAVVAAYYRGTVSAMPVISVISLSGDPPLIGIASSPSHATHGTIVKAKRMSVSWLDRRFTEAVEALGSTSGAGVRDKLAAVGLHYALKGEPLVPVIKEASAYLECALSSVQPFGDHELLVARVEEARAVEDFKDYWAFRTYRPILYSGVGRRPPTVGRVRRSGPKVT